MFPFFPKVGEITLYLQNYDELIVNIAELEAQIYTLSTYWITVNGRATLTHYFSGELEMSNLTGVPTYALQNFEQVTVKVAYCTSYCKDIKFAMFLVFFACQIIFPWIDE